MKILLMNSPLFMQERSSMAVVRHIQEPLGLAYLAAAIRARRPQEEISILDCQVLNYSLADVKEYFSGRVFDVVGISMPTLTFYNTQKTAEVVKQMTGATVFVGGPHPTALPRDTLKKVPQVDFEIIGEGEETVVELLSAVERQDVFGHIKGIVYRSGEDILETAPRPYIQDIDTIPMPARDLLMMKKYSPSPTFFQKFPAYAIIDARGCPCNCSFCATQFGKSIRSHSTNRICEEIELLVRDYGAKCIIFRSDTFTFNVKRTEELCREIIKRKLHKKISWHCQSRINTVNKELLQLMKRAGCEGIHYGVESGVPRLLEILNKRIKLEDVPNVLKWTRQAGIMSSSYFMIGIPTETREETIKTIEYAKTCGTDFMSLSIFTPYPGSELFDRIKADGKLRTEDWRNFSSELSFSQRETPYVPKGRDELDLKQLHRRAILDFYLRPRVILRQIMNIKSLGRLIILIRAFLSLVMLAVRSRFSGLAGRKKQ